MKQLLKSNLIRSQVEKGIGQFFLSIIHLYPIQGQKHRHGMGTDTLSVFAMDSSFISGFSFGPESDYSRLPSVSNSEYFNYFRRVCSDWLRDGILPRRTITLS